MNAADIIMVIAEGGEVAEAKVREASEAIGRLVQS
jgi:hypothetical protein